MKSGNRYSLYIFLVILIGLGLTLYLSRDQAATFLNDSTGISSSSVPEKIASSSQNAIDLALFTNSKFISLKNNITKFNFNTICKTPVGQLETVATSSDGTTATSTQILSCVQGNSQPFQTPVKIK